MTQSRLGKHAQTRAARLSKATQRNTKRLQKQARLGTRQDQKLKEKLYAESRAALSSESASQYNANKKLEAYMLSQRKPGQGLV